MAMFVFKPYQKTLLVFLTTVWMGFALVIPLRAEGDGMAAGRSIQATLNDAILMALENNQSLRVERLTPQIQRTFEGQEQALFDPLLNARMSVEKDRFERVNRSSGAEENSLAGNIALEKFFPTGTTVTASGNIDWLDSSMYDDQFTQARLGLSVTQALLRGAGTGVNLANLRQARLETEASQYELRGFSEILLSQVELAYWELALAQRQITIVEESLQLAEQHQKETQDMISVGKMAESELVATKAEIALRRQELIEARSNMKVRRLQLLRLLNPPGADPFKWEVILLSRPDLTNVRLDPVDAHVAVARRMRPVLNQARRELHRDELELVKTKNGLLPRLDFFITLGKSGYADSFDDSVGDIPGDGYDVSTGIRFEFPLKNRKAASQYHRARLNREQAQKALDNLSQLVELDVRTAFIEVDRSRQQITASAETRKLEEEKLRIETEKLRVGKSTNFLVAQAQRDLLLSQVVEVRAVASYLKSLTELFRLEGSLLERRGVSAPGREPSGPASDKPNLSIRE